MIVQFQVVPGAAFDDCRDLYILDDQGRFWMRSESGDWQRIEAPDATYTEAPMVVDDPLRAACDKECTVLSDWLHNGRGDAWDTIENTVVNLRIALAAKGGPA